MGSKHETAGEGAGGGGGGARGERRWRVTAQRRKGTAPLAVVRARDAEQAARAVRRTLAPGEYLDDGPAEAGVMIECGEKAEVAAGARSAGAKEGMCGVWEDIADGTAKEEGA